MNPLRAVKGALLYTKAGNRIDERDYRGAQKAIRDAEAVIGEALNKPGMFEFHIRKALIDNKLGETDAAAVALERAIESITQLKRLSEPDRNYLLDYCDRFMMEIRGVTGSWRYRIHKDQYQEVTKRYRRAYPLRWLD